VILGKEKELTIEIITPNFRDHDKEDLLKGQTMGYNTLLMMVLPDENKMFEDVIMYLKTDKYIRIAQSTTNKDNVKRILFEKAQNNTKRRGDLVTLLRRLLAESTVYMNGMKQDVNGSSDGKTRVVNAFQNLIKLAYPNLKMLGKTIFSEETIKSIIKSKQDDLFGTDDTTMSEAESEMLNIIHRRKKQSDRTSLIDLRDYFSRKPYGWYQNAIWSIAAKLYKRGKLEFKQESNLLDDDGVLNALMNNRLYSNTLLEPLVEIDPKLIKELATVYNEFFDETCPFKEARDVANAFKNKLTDEYIWLNQLLMNKDKYPFLTELEPVSDFIEKLTKKDYSYFLTHVKEFEDELIDKKEEIIDPIKRFWNGEQKKIYDSIQVFFTGNQSNLEYVEGDELNILTGVIEHKQPYKGNIIKDAKATKDALTGKVKKLIEEERQLTEGEIDKAIKRIQSHEDYKKLNESQKKEVIKPFEEELKKVKDQRFIANLRETRAKVKGSLLEHQLNEMVRLATPPEVDEPVVHYQRLTSVKVNFPKSELQTVEDVDEYVKALKAALAELIKQNKRISL